MHTFPLMYTGMLIQREYTRHKKSSFANITNVVSALYTDRIGLWGIIKDTTDVRHVFEMTLKYTN